MINSVFRLFIAVISNMSSLHAKGTV